MAGMKTLVSSAILCVLLSALPAHAQLVAAVLPSSRAVQVGTPATAFATMINSGTTTATGCGIAQGSVPAAFVYQTTDPATNAPTGTPNTPASIPPGQAQTFVVALTPTAPFSATEVQFAFTCANVGAAPSVPGVNTLRLSACSGATTDVITLSTTPSGDGIARVPGASGITAFGVVAQNVGATSSAAACGGAPGLQLLTSFVARAVTAAPNTVLSICQTDPTSGECAHLPGDTATIFLVPGTSATLSVFVQATGTIPFDPANSRIRVTFTETQNTVVNDTHVVLVVGERGSTSVAVTTELPTN
jgi:hypothetical protein